MYDLLKKYLHPTYVCCQESLSEVLVAKWKLRSFSPPPTLLMVFCAPFLSKSWTTTIKKNKKCNNNNMKLVFYDIFLEIKSKASRFLFKCPETWWMYSMIISFLHFPNLYSWDLVKNNFVLYWLKSNKLSIAKVWFYIGILML